MKVGFSHSHRWKRERLPGNMQALVIVIYRATKSRPDPKPLTGEMLEGSRCLK
jgi:hypothetical protein